MKQSLLFTAVLCGMLTAASAMAEDDSTDFHALSAMSSPVPAMAETQIASVEGGLVMLPEVPEVPLPDVVIPGIIIID